MTAEARVAAPPDQATSPAVVAHPPRQRSGPASRDYQAPTRAGTDPARDDPAVTGLVTRARHGDKQALDALVERYAPLIWSICRRHRLARADAEDVGQSVWLQLVDQLDRVAIRPPFPAGWPP